MFIVKPELDEEQVGTASDRVHQLIVANGGSVTKTAAWGKRRLAYRVGPHREGYYVVSNFDIETGRIAELERVLKISDTVFRHLLVRRDAPAVGQTEVYVPEASAEEIAAMSRVELSEEEQVALDELDEREVTEPEMDTESVRAVQPAAEAETARVPAAETAVPTDSEEETSHEPE